jgi:hypothetical protein
MRRSGAQRQGQALQPPTMIDVHMWVLATTLKCRNKQCEKYLLKDGDRTLLYAV